MEAERMTLVLTGLSSLQQLDLQKALGPETVKFKPQPDSGDAHNELATVGAIVYVSLQALRVLAVYLSKNINKTSIRKVVEVVDPDGTRRTTRIIYDGASSDTKADILKQLAELCKVDISSLIKDDENTKGDLNAK